MGIPETWIDQVHQIDNGWRLAAFTVVGIVLIGFLVLNKKLDKHQRRFAVTVMILSVVVSLLPYLADALHKPPMPDSLTLSVMVMNQAGFPCQENEAVVNAGNADIVFKHAQSAGVWEAFIHKADMPSTGILLVYAYTADRKCKAEQQVNLFDSNRASVELHLQCVPAPRTFSINVGDPTLLRDVLATTSYTLDPLSPNKIIFTYDPGKIIYRPLTGSYIFVASCLYVHINGTAVPLNGCIIPGSLPSSYKENIIEYCRGQSQQKAREFLQKNPHQLVEWIQNFSH